MILNHGIWGRDVITGFNSVQDLLTSYDKVDIYGGSVGTIIDKLWGRNIPLSFNDIYHMTSSNYFPSWTPETYMYAEFNGSIEAGNIIGLTERITFWNLYRQEVLPQEDGTYIPIGKFTFLDKIPADVRTYTDYTTTRQKYYRYYLFAQTETQFSQPALLPEIKSEYYGYYLIDMITNQTFKIDIGITGGDQTINMKYSQYDTNTKYNAIQKAVTNYKSGNLGGLLIENNDIDKVDNSIDLLEEFREFVYKDGIKFLKTRKGEMFNVFLSDYNETLIQQGIKEQPMLSSFAWREINDIVQPIDIEEDINAYRLYFSGNYEDSPREQVKYVKYENPIGILPNITRAGYTFLGWFVAKTGGTKLSSASILSGTDNKVVYAQWKANKYTIVFNKNSADATGTMANQIVAYDTEVMLSQNTFKRANYEFVGWNTGKNGNETEYSDIQFISNLTDIDGAVINLYAQWQKIRLVVARYNIGRLTLTDAVATLYDDGVMEFTGVRDTIVMTGIGQQPWGSELALIKSVTFSNTIRPTDLSYYFISCTKLTSISNIPNSAQLSNYTFHTCISLVTPPTLPIGITSLDGTFGNCSAMTTAPVIPSTVVTMSSTFYQVPLVNPPIIPNGVTNMNTCFFGCIKLISAPVLPGNLNTMVNTFNGCIAIVTAPIIPSGVVSMSGSFSGCTALKTFATLPPRVLNINHTFNNCKSLNGKMLIETVPTSYASFFVNCSTNVDANLVVDYTNANKNIIDAIIATKSTGSHITKGGNVDALKTYNIGNPTPTSVQATLYKDGLLEITGTGNTIAMASKDAQPWNAERMLIKSITFASTVKSTNLNNYFNSLVNLVNVSALPTSVTTMQNTFDGCTSLVTAPAIPSGVTNINFIFYNCTALVNAFTIPNTVTNMSYAFAFCSSLVTPPAISNKTIIMNYAFNSCTKLVTAPVIPNTVLDMSYTFQNCKALQVAPVLPNAITTLPATFYGCNSMGVAPAIPASVVHMNTTFYQCTTLKATPLMPNTVTDMAYCYGGCTSLVTVTNIPDRVLFIGTAFASCSKLTGKMLLKAKPTIYNLCFDSCSTDANANLVVDYNNNSAPVVDAIIATKSTGSHITKGVNIDVVIVGTYKIGNPNAENVVATIDSEGNFVVTGSGNTVKYPSSPSDVPWYSNRNLIKSVSFGASVEPLDMSNWFNGCINLTNVENIPNSIETMNSTFSNCQSLVNPPIIPNGVEMMSHTFQECTALTTMPVIPNSVQSFQNVFMDCTSLVNTTTLPDSIKYMAGCFIRCKSLVTAPVIPINVISLYETFARCTSLLNVTILSTKIENMSSMFKGCTSLVTTPSIPVQNNKNISMANAFEECTSLKNAEINPSVTNLSSTFKGCTSLVTAPSIHDSVTNMSETFYGCTSLINIPNIPPNIVKLSRTFYDCTSLVSVPIITSSKITDMDYTFYRCSKLTDVAISDTCVVTKQETTNTFKGCTSLVSAPNLPKGLEYTYGIFEGCTSLVNAPMLPEGITQTRYMFSGCTSLINPPVIPESVTNMNNTFSNCPKLTSAPALPNKLIDMYYTFSDCESLTQAPLIPISATVINGTFQGCTSLVIAPIIPNRVDNFRDAFRGCTSLTTFPGIVPETVTSMYYAFSYCSNLRGEITIKAKTNYIDKFFLDCSTEKNANLIVHYANCNENNINDIIGTKSYNSNITKGINVDSVIKTYNIGSPVATDVVATLYRDYADEMFGSIDCLVFKGTGDTISLTDKSQQPWINERDLIQDVIFLDTVKSTNLDYYFNSLENLTMVSSLPDSITSMDYAFQDCHVLGDVYADIVNCNVTKMDFTFQRCYKLMDFSSVPKSLKSATGTFYDCYSLPHIAGIQNCNLDSLQATFCNCRSLTRIVNFTNHVKSLVGTFSGCTGLTEVATTFPYEVIDMSGTFRDCTNLVKMTEIPDQVINMPNVFKGCTSLKDISKLRLESCRQLLNMGDSFEGCESLSGETTINVDGKLLLPTVDISFKNCFLNCATKEGAQIIVNYTSKSAPIVDALIATKSVNSNIIKGVNIDIYKTYNIGSPVATDVVATLYGEGYDNYSSVGLLEINGKGDTISFGSESNSPWKNELTRIKKVIFEDTVKSTNLDYYFSGCEFLESVSSIPSSAKSMNSTFYACDKLESSPAIPNGVTAMDKTFSGCASMSTAPVLPTSITNLNGTFYNCMTMTTAPVIPNSAETMVNTFTNCAITTAPIIPNKVTTLKGTFESCRSLITAPTIPVNVKNIEGTFKLCSKLSGKLLIESNPDKYTECFLNCSTNASANLVVDYVAVNEQTIDSIIATKSANSKITKGNHTGGVKSWNIGNPIATDVVATLYKDGTLEITGAGDTIPMTMSGRPWATEANLFFNISFAPTVKSTNLSNYFSDCVGLTSVTGIPDTVTNLYNTFYGCTALVTAPTIPNSVTNMMTTFDGCTSLTKVSSISNNVAGMTSTFQGCTSLVTAPAIPNSVTGMSGTFRECTSLATAPVLPNGVTYIGNIFDGCISLTKPPIIPASVTNMHSSFQNCTKLTTAPAIPTGVNIMISTFNGCSSLVTAPVIPNSATTINYIFQGCTSLVTAPAIPSRVISIDYAFRGCTSLVTAPTIPINIGNMAYTFYDCPKLTGKILIQATPKNSKNYDNFFIEASTTTTANLIVDYGKNNSHVIDAIIATKSAGSHITKGVNVDIVKSYNIGNPTPTSVVATLYNDGALEIAGTGNIIFVDSKDDQPWVNERKSIRKILFSSTVESINLNNYFDSLINLNSAMVPAGTITMNNTFTNCTSLVSAPVIPNGVTHIDFLFYNCVSLISVSAIPSTVTNMSYAFAFCSSLVTPPAISNKTTIMNHSFVSCSKLVSAPVIPNTVVDMSYAFQGCIFANAPALPVSVTNISYTFQNCAELTTAPTIPSNVTNMDFTFNGCTKLKGNLLIEVKSTTTYANCFENCSVDISPDSLVVNYTSTNASIIDTIIATKSSTSNIIKGVQKP